MSISAETLCSIKFTGDQENELVYSSGELEDSPCYQQLVTLSSGDNAFDVPDVEDFTVHGLAVVPPSLNEMEPVIKGSTTDTGLTLSATQVSVVQFGTTPPSEVVLVASTNADGFRLIWF